MYYFCREHYTYYGEDGFMCPECEREIELESVNTEWEEHQQERYPDGRRL